MENETIDTTLLPKFEEVQFSVLDADYWKVTVLNVFVFLIVGLGLGVLLFFNRGLCFFGWNFSGLFSLSFLCCFVIIEN
jgi:hypothetical protein